MEVVWWLVTLLVFLLTLAVAKWALDITHYPSGPLPWPIIGNLLAFRGRSMKQTVDVLRARYGDMFTVWFGSKPVLFVTSWDLSKEGLVTKKNDFSGRLRIRAQNMLLRGHTDIAFSDPSPTWEVLRKIGFSAIRKYTPLPQLRDNMAEVTDSVIAEMLQEEGPIDPRDYLQFIVFNVVAYIAYQLRFDKGDKDLAVIKDAQDTFPAILGQSIPGDFVPILKLFEGSLEETMRNTTTKILGVTERLFKEHQDSYNGEIRDFTDAVLAAREEADPNETGFKDLTDGELKMVLTNLFNAGVATTKETISWVVLLLAIHQRVQEKVAKEILSVIGDRQPSQVDRKQCPYTVATILEVLRYRSPTIVGLPHKTICDTTLGGKPIPKDTAVIFFQETVHFDPSHWGPDPGVFRPERFVDDPDATRSHFMPFGVGRRSCIGERLAHANLFLILARLVQRTTFRFHGEPDDQPDPATVVNCITKPYKVVFSAR